MKLAARKLTTCLWFDTQAEEAANFYASIFKDAKVGKITRYGKEGHEIHGKAAGSVMTVEFEIAGHVLLYFLVRRLMVEAAVARGTHPLRLSFKHALAEFNDLLPFLHIAAPQTVRKVLLPRLLDRIAQHSISIRPGRHFPRLGDQYKLCKYRKRSKIKAKHT